MSSKFYASTGVMFSGTGVLFSNPGVVFPNTGVLYPRTGVLDLVPGVVEANPGVVHASTGVLFSRTGMMEPSTGALFSRTGVMFASTGGERTLAQVGICRSLGFVRVPETDVDLPSPRTEVLKTAWQLSRIASVWVERKLPRGEKGNSARRKVPAFEPLDSHHSSLAPRPIELFSRDEED